MLHVAAMPVPSPQGTQASIRAMVRAHLEAGDETHLLAYAHGDGTPIDDGLVLHRAGDGARDRSLRSGPSARKLVSDVALARALARVTRAYDFDLVIAHHVEAALACAAVLRREWTFVAHTALGAELPSYTKRAGFAASFAGDMLERRLVRNAPRVLAIAPRLVRHLHVLHGRDVGLVTIPWQTMRTKDVTDTTDDEARRTARNELGFAPNDRVFLYAGNFDAYQGLDVAMDGFERAGDPSCKLLVLSASGPRDFPIEDRRRVRFAPLADRTRTLAHAACDAAIVPRSHLGGVAIKLLDALERRAFVLASPLATGGYEFAGDVRIVEHDAISWSREFASFLPTKKPTKSSIDAIDWSASSYLSRVGR